MIAILNNEAEAVKLSTDIHNFLTANRARYNATHWSDINKGEADEWMVKIPYDYQNWNAVLDLGTSEKTQDLPEIGQEVLIDNYYLYKGSVLKCRQTHNRTIYDPKDTPALFSFFRDNSDQLQWIEGEQVEVGWVRFYNEIKYEVIQAHQTQSDWTPNVANTLWKVWVDPNAIPEISEWVQPGSTNPYMKGDQVLFNGNTYESLINANVWSPTGYPAGWNQL